jgi:hypothetical protein
MLRRMFASNERKKYDDGGNWILKSLTIYKFHLGKSRRMRWTGYIERTEKMINAYEILVGMEAITSDT